MTLNRRKFIQWSLALTGVAGMTNCNSRKKKIHCEIIDTSSHRGHIIRDQEFISPSTFTEKKVVIVGGGISGLTAAYHLQKNGISDFVLFDLENEVGGNSRFGINKVSEYPWGAHYIPVPNNDLTEYISFLNDCNVITHYSEDGLPVYNEQYLCFDPQERLYINGKWQEGLIPDYGVPYKDKQEIKKFLSLMDDFRYKKGSDGKDAFAIPVDLSSLDADFRQLDTLTMKEWMELNEFKSNYLHWYVNYCTRDDFGTKHSEVSAWVGIHYFASRKGKAVNANHNDVLTWPEGNGFLVKQLEKNISGQIKAATIVIKVEAKEDYVMITYMDPNTKVVSAVKASHCIMAVPQFIAARLLHDTQRLQQVKKYFQYTPWIVGNFTVSGLRERSGAPQSWDNVLYESESLGYVVATHELLQQRSEKQNLTYYLPLTSQIPVDARQSAQKKTAEDWLARIIGDLKIIHPNIEEVIEDLKVMVLGHPMAQPLPGMIYGGYRKQMSLPLNEKIFFAHTDLAGVSIFEEAFYQGLGAAKQVLSKIGKYV